MHSYLKEILAKKKQEVALLAKNDVVLAAYDQAFEATGAFKKSLMQSGLSVIAEVKRQSPSKGHLADIPDPVNLAAQYAAGGAAALSVLTDKFGFNGSIDDLKKVTQAVNCSVLRKDFVIDELQLAEAAISGASAALLIVAVLGDDTKKYIKACERFGLDALVEVHNRDELDIAIAANARIIGVNNRNLETFDVDIQNALTLFDAIPGDVISVAESGISDIETAKLYQACGYDAILVGEALVRSGDPASFIQALKDR